MKIKSSMESFRSPSPLSLPISPLPHPSFERARDPWIRPSLSLSILFSIFFEIFVPRSKENRKRKENRIDFRVSESSVSFVIHSFNLREWGGDEDELEISIGGKLSRSVNLYLNHFVPSYQLPFCRNNFTLLLGHSFPSLDPVHPTALTHLPSLSFSFPSLPPSEPRRRQPVPLTGY